MSSSQRDVVEALRVALKERDRLRVENGRLLAGAGEPIAIVGMGCRFPGGADTPEQLWQLLAEGTDTITAIPGNRGWDLERIYDPEPGKPGLSYVRDGGFLGEASGFDPLFFGLPPREAPGGDPQQRLLLEVSWEALEDAGILPASLHGSQTGVFAGAMYHDYGWGRGAGTSEQDGPGPTVGVGSILSGRIAYTFGLEGPAITVDTACSSSLVAIHLAVQALRGGECALALAGGVTVLSTPRTFIEASRQRGLAADGRCKSFAESADGVGFAEGVGVVMLERLSDAERNGHRVLATIRGSAVNQDGASNGLSAPNGPAQERVIRQALAAAGLTPADVDAVEAHGTGTMLGDPIEAGALLATYGQERETPLKLGSIKSNIGHSQAGAGVAGVIKTVMAMREGMLPKTLHVDAPSTKIDWEAGKVELLTEPAEWVADGRPRRAGVSSFGASGTNAHLILEEAPASSPAAGSEDRNAGEAPAAPLPGTIPLLLSAKSKEALGDAAGRLAAHLRENPDLPLLDVAYSLATTRTQMESRAAVVGNDREQLLGGLSALAKGTAAPNLARGRARAERNPVFLFPGYGAQWQGMALELIETAPVFARRMKECAEALEPHLEYPLDDLLRGTAGAPSLELPLYGTPALFATGVSLVELWRSCGVEPAAVAGHSQGEMIAAHAVGALTLDEAAAAAMARIKVMMALEGGQGAMASVALSEAELESRLERWQGRIGIAALNGPGASVVSGDADAVDELLAQCEADGTRARKVRGVTGASHSHQVEPLREQILEALAPLRPRSSEIPFHSTVTGGPLDTAELDAEYWYRNLRQTVRLAPLVESLIAAGHRTLIEVGPHPVLSIGLQETVEAGADPGAVAILGTLRRDDGGPDRFALSLAEAHAAGAGVDWDRFYAGTNARAVPLPTYPFQRKHYWLAPGGGEADPSTIGLGDAEHPLLRASVEDPEGERLTLTGRISLAEQPWLADHAVGATVLLPGPGLLELALRAAAEADCERLDELDLEAPLPVPLSGGVQLQVRVGEPGEGGVRSLSIHSRAEAEAARWTCHARGTISPAARNGRGERLDAWPPAGAEPIDVEAAYDRLADLGLDYGPAFQGLTAAWRSGEEIFVEAALAPEQAPEAPRFALHPALLDAVLHGAFAGARSDGDGDSPARLPVGWSGVTLREGGVAELRARVAPGEGGSIALTIADREGAAVAEVEALRLQPLAVEQLAAARRPEQGLLGIEWLPLEAGEGDAPEAGAGALAADEAPDLIRLDQLEFERTPDLAATARAAAVAALRSVQGWLADSPAQSRLVVLTGGAVVASTGEDPDPAAAAVWGLVRSAQAEHPGRIALIDSDRAEASATRLEQAIAIAEEEPQLALREGALFAPRAVPLEQAAGTPEGAFDPDRTVLIAGAGDGLGALIAGHLAGAHGVDRVLLSEAVDREQLRAELDSIDPAHPLGAVFHAASLGREGLFETLAVEDLEQALEARAGTASLLHELSEQLDLTAFVTFGTAVRALGGVGQAHAAAADAFLVALSQHRRHNGLAATTVAWGLWDEESGIEPGLDETARGRLQASGLVPISSERGLALFDAALADSVPALVLAAPLDRATLRGAAATGTLPATLRRLAPQRRRRRSNAGGSLGRKLAALSEAEREPFVLELVQAEAAAVLGYDSPAEVDPERAFNELGFDSAGAVELRNRLGEATGMRLPATLVFDYPSTAELARYLAGQATDGGASRQTVLRAQSSEEPIAIVGMSCRYPGEVGSPSEFWELVAGGRDAIGEFPTDRGWDLERIYDPNPETPGTSYSREGGFLYDVADFDPAFFGISPREALVMDPQQRLLLEASWEALEDAGIDPVGLRGAAAGIFAGVSALEYTGGITNPDEEFEGYRLTGAVGSVVSGRVAYALGLEGPAMTVDTACSSSLVAIHLASQALRAGECEMALAGGVTVLSTPTAFVEFSRQRGLAPDGRCKSFAEAADGVGWSEGVGMIALERLSDAERNGHRVLATIRGSAVNQDGASNGLTAPNGPSQERVIRQALANARLEAGDVDVVEAHGTGTMLGDPIEAGALLATYGQEREKPLKLGSVKSNIGHAQAAAGVAGVIKSVMAMREGVLPKTLHVDSPSTKIDWEAGEIELLTEASEWKPNGHPRRAAVSSFGVSGTNAHLILEEGPATGRGSTGSRETQGPVPFLLSAKTPEALRASAARLATHLEDNPDLEPLDVARSLIETRAQLERRAVAVGSDREELLASLSAVAQDRPSPDTATARAKSGRLAYLFTGQGSQRPGMGKELYETYSVYAKALDGASAEIDKHLDRPLKDLIFSESGSEEAELLDDTAYAQPALFATELALYRLFESLGLKPDLLTGHSVGEIVAAHISGVFSLEDAAKLVAARGKLMGALPEGGAMLALQATEQEALESIEGREDFLSLAAVNSPNACVVSGAEDAIAELEAHWQERDRKTKRLQVSHAFHSPLVEPMLEPFAEVLASLELSAPNLPVISNLSGEPLAPEQATDPAYWVSHARQPVRFADAVATLRDQGATTYMELGPDAVLTAMAAETLAGEDGAVSIPTLREGREEERSIALALGTAHASGAKLNWAAFFKGTGAREVPLPTYPFQRKRYWLDSVIPAADPSAVGQAAAEHPLLGATIEDPQTGGLILTGRISLQTHPWLAEHAVFGKAILPHAAFLELALRAGAEARCELLEELALQAPLLIPEAGGTALQVSLSAKEDDGKRQVSIHSRAEASPDEEPGEWVCHAQGTLSDREPDPAEPLEAWPPEGAEALAAEDVYGRLADLGFDYGHAFQGLTAAWRRGDEVFAEVSLAEEQESEAARFAVHPALLDSALHGGLELMAGSEGKPGAGGPMLPFAWAGVRVESPGRASLRVRLAARDGSLALSAFDEANAPVLAVASAIAREVSPEQLGGQGTRRKDLLTLEWAQVAPAPMEGPQAKLVALPELGLERDADTARAAHAATVAALELIQATLAEEAGEGEEPTRLALLTEGALAARPGEGSDPAAAAVWGLVRSAQTENPGRFALIDSDGSEASRQAISKALAAGATEPQLALREGELLAPRVSDEPGRGVGLVPPEDPPPIDPERTVLISGATGTLGALVAHHLVEAHGARHLLLAGRAGPAAKGAKELAERLEGAGAQVRIEACDVSSREQVEALIDSIDPEYPLGAVIHAAGVIEDGIAATLSAEQLDRVLAPKVDGAWNLHELSKEMDLSAFVMFSSLAGTIGGPGQGNYAAANVFMDALAQHRQAHGLTATSIAWGMWESESAITGDLDEADKARAKRVGATEITDERGLELFDAALERLAPLVLAAPVERAALARMDAAGMLPPILRGLLPRRSERRRTPSVSLAERLARVPEAEHEAAVLELVREEAAAVLGHSSGREVAPEQPFSELGFDSLAAVEMRNRLGAMTGMQLPATVVFDYPNATALAGFLLRALGEGGKGGIDDELGQFELALAELPAGDPQRQALAGHLRALAADLEGDGASEESGSEIDRLEEASDEELLEFIDQQVGG